MQWQNVFVTRAHVANVSRLPMHARIELIVVNHFMATFPSSTIYIHESARQA